MTRWSSKRWSSYISHTKWIRNERWKTTKEKRYPMMAILLVEEESCPSEPSHVCMRHKIPWNTFLLRLWVQQDQMTPKISFEGQQVWGGYCPLHLFLSVYRIVLANFHHAIEWALSGTDERLLNTRKTLSVSSVCHQLGLVQVLYLLTPFQSSGLPSACMRLSSRVHYSSVIPSVIIQVAASLFCSPLQAIVMMEVAIMRHQCFLSGFQGKNSKRRVHDG